MKILGMSTSVMYTMEGKNQSGGPEPCSYALGIPHGQLIVKIFQCGSRGNRGGMRRFEGESTAKADDLLSLSVTE